MKRVIRHLLFRLSPERAHHLSFTALRWLMKIPFVKGMIRGHYEVVDPKLERKLFGLTFKNPVGLAAGLDKDAKLFQELGALGFGFVEIGTITPKAQEGNPQPRLFRLLEDEAIINRMGFNNEGVEIAVERLKNRPKELIVGGNIGKNRVTPNELAVEDYLYSFRVLSPYVDYFVVNVSSPNTPNLRDLQEREPLTKLLLALQSENRQQTTERPILLKIAPDLSNDQLRDIIEIVEETKISGVIATNTTLSREGLVSKEREEAGGLSGKPLQNRSTEVIRFLHQESGGAFPIIGVGGIHSAEDALEKFEAGASLIQLYSGFIYEGPALIRSINRALLEREEG